MLSAAAIWLPAATGACRYDGVGVRRSPALVEATDDLPQALPAAGRPRPLPPARRRTRPVGGAPLPADRPGLPREPTIAVELHGGVRVGGDPRPRVGPSATRGAGDLCRQPRDQIAPPSLAQTGQVGRHGRTHRPAAWRRIAPGRRHRLLRRGPVRKARGLPAPRHRRQDPSGGDRDLHRAGEAGRCPAPSARRPLHPRLWDRRARADAATGRRRGDPLVRARARARTAPPAGRLPCTAGRGRGRGREGAQLRQPDALDPRATLVRLSLARSRQLLHAPDARRDRPCRRNESRADGPPRPLAAERLLYAVLGRDDSAAAASVPRLARAA